MSNPEPSVADPLLVIAGDEQRQVDERLSDGGLPPAIGVQSWQVFRASTAAAALTDRRGWTYHHHVDMACWRGRLYVGWNSCRQDEDVWPSRELFSTSIDGALWSEPRELFPQGISTPLRMYFFLAPNGRMLAIAGLRVDRQDTREDRKSGLVVREIGVDHRLGEVWTLQHPGGETALSAPPLFETSGDKMFVEACRQLWSNTIYLEQQDSGRLLGQRRMKWHDAAAWPNGKVPGDNEKWICGKAYSFFERPDGLRVGISKMGWTSSTADGGLTWSRPDVPPSLVTDKAKVWAQRTADGRYALVYNPSRKHRFPLVIVTSSDGRVFSDMRLVQGELPRQRYVGRHRSVGPQYVRGISEWSNDGSKDNESAMWLVYSMSKEDIWVSRVPVPVRTNPSSTSNAEPMQNPPVGAILSGWNTYCPRWADVRISPSGDGAGNRLRLESHDPYDYARAVWVWGRRSEVRVAFEVFAPVGTHGPLHIELFDEWGARRAVCLTIGATGELSVGAAAGEQHLGRAILGQWTSLVIEASIGRNSFDLWMTDVRIGTNLPLAEAVQSLHRISFRTGEYRNHPIAQPVEVDTDIPVSSTYFDIRGLRVQ